MQRKKEIPSKPDFYNATKKAYELLIELEVTSLPVNPFDIFKQFENSWHLLSWSELKRNTGEDDPLNIKRDKAEAKTVILRGTNEYLIVYDDSFGNERIRWTLAHEIGHIVLGHLIHYDATALNRRGLTKQEYGVLEVEAHWFAEGLLASNFLLNLFQINTSQQIAFLCDISKDASDKCIKHIQNNNYRNDEYVEMKLLRNFYSFFAKDEYLKSITNGINKFESSYLYHEFVSYCRICRKCNAYIIDGKQEYCHICGQKTLDVFSYFPYTQFPSGGLMRGFPTYLEGKYYSSISTDKESKVIFCPRCKNHSFSKDAEYCSICGTPLYNRCLNEDKILEGDKRYCPDCGSNTLFNELNLFDIKRIEPKDTIEYSTMDISDYIEYEYWDYIRDAIFVFEGNVEAFSALHDTVAFIDGDNFAIVSNNPMSINTIEKYEQLIISTLKKYGLIDISNIVVFYEN